MIDANPAGGAPHLDKVRNFRDAGGLKKFSRTYYRHIVFEQAPRIGRAISLLATEGNLPAVLHCRAGKDRTGLLVSVMHLLVGVPYAGVRAEFLRTNDAYAPALAKATRTIRILTLFRVPKARIRFLLTAHAELLDDVYEAIGQKYGSIEAYVGRACEVDRDTVERLRVLLVA